MSIIHPFRRLAGLCFLALMVVACEEERFSLKGVESLAVVNIEFDTRIERIGDGQDTETPKNDEAVSLTKQDYRRLNQLASRIFDAFHKRTPITITPLNVLRTEKKFDTLPGSGTKKRRYIPKPYRQINMDFPDNGLELSHLFNVDAVASVRLAFKEQVKDKKHSVHLKAKVVILDGQGRAVFVEKFDIQAPDKIRRADPAFTRVRRGQIFFNSPMFKASKISSRQYNHAFELFLDALVSRINQSRNTDL